VPGHQLLERRDQRTAFDDAIRLAQVDARLGGGRARTGDDLRQQQLFGRGDEDGQRQREIGVRARGEGRARRALEPPAGVTAETRLEQPRKAGLDDEAVPQDLPELPGQLVGVPPDQRELLRMRLRG
jgi:hypothetical protein